MSAITSPPILPESIEARAYSIPEVAERLSMSPRKIYGLIRLGDLRSIMVGRKSRR